MCMPRSPWYPNHELWSITGGLFCFAPSEMVTHARSDFFGPAHGVIHQQTLFYLLQLHCCLSPERPKQALLFDLQQEHKESLVFKHGPQAAAPTNCWDCRTAPSHRNPLMFAVFKTPAPDHSWQSAEARAEKLPECTSQMWFHIKEPLRSWDESTCLCFVCFRVINAGKSALNEDQACCEVVVARRRPMSYCPPSTPSKTPTAKRRNSLPNGEGLGLRMEHGMLGEVISTWCVSYMNAVWRHPGQCESQRSSSLPHSCINKTSCQI